MCSTRAAPPAGWECSEARVQSFRSSGASVAIQSTAEWSTVHAFSMGCGLFPLSLPISTPNPGGVEGVACPPTMGPFLPPPPPPSGDRGGHRTYIWPPSLYRTHRSAPGPSPTSAS
eukprot:13083939-Alexandrium_andersonii.AAC.1